MPKKRQLDLIGYAGVIIHAPGGVLMTSGQPILTDKRLLKAATECMEHIKADAKDDGVPHSDLRDYLGIALCETVIATTQTENENDEEIFVRLTALLALSLHNNASHMVIEGRVDADVTITVLNFFVIPANDFDHGRAKIIRYFEALNNLLAHPDQQKSVGSGGVVLH